MDDIAINREELQVLDSKSEAFDKFMDWLDYQFKHSEEKDSIRLCMKTLANLYQEASTRERHYFPHQDSPLVKLRLRGLLADSSYWVGSHLDGQFAGHTFKTGKTFRYDEEIIVEVPQQLVTIRVCLPGFIVVEQEHVYTKNTDVWIPIQVDPNYCLS